MKNIFDTISVIISTIALIISIVHNSKEQKNNIILEKKIRDQEKFEQEINDILNLYPVLIEDYINKTYLDIREVTPELQIKFDIESIDKINGLNSKYHLKIQGINNKINLLYKYQDLEHPEFDKFSIKLRDINGSIGNVIAKFSTFPSECVNHNQGFTETEAQAKMAKRSEFVNELCFLYTSNIDELYILANACIEERNKLSMNKWLSTLMTIIYFYKFLSYNQLL